MTTGRINQVTIFETPRRSVGQSLVKVGVIADPASGSYRGVNPSIDQLTIQLPQPNFPQ